MAYTYDYIGLANRILEDYNEVLLTNGTFSSAVGFQGAVLDWINDALVDIYTFEDTQWPFLFVTNTFTTTISEGFYTTPSTLLSVDWDSFCISKPSLPVTSITYAAGVATVTVSVGHQLLPNLNDVAIINGATQNGFNGQWSINYVSPTVFTYSPTNTAGLPSTATGTITLIPPYANQYLTLMNYDLYLRDWYDVDVQDNQQATYNAAGGTNQDPSVPRFIVRKPDNNMILSPWPDRVYTIQYNGRTNPIGVALVNATDVPLVPSVFRQVIVDRVGVYALAFRDNDTQLLRNDKRFTDNLNVMRRILIPQTEYITFKN